MPFVTVFGAGLQRKTLFLFACVRDVYAAYFKVMTEPKSILLTGATGYIGGRLCPELEAAGHKVYCLTRRAEALRQHVGPDTHLIESDVLDRDSLPDDAPAFDVAFYLIHSMGDKGSFSDKERLAATNFASWAARIGVKRIIYLGGLGNTDKPLSKHLRSRQDTGDILRQSSVPVIELRASIILGSGSLSFELIRALVERLPVMVCPRWVRVEAQPISVEDTLAYLLEAMDIELEQSRIYEIGGPDRVAYGDIMTAYAEARGLHRRMFPVPVLTPHLSSLWLGLVTPVYARIGRKLIEGVRYPTVVQDNSALQDFKVRPMGLQQAIQRALINEDHSFAQTRWSDALSSTGDRTRWGGLSYGARRLDSRVVKTNLSGEMAFAPIQRIGGETGWFFANSLWRVRGFLDLLVGGVGVRRGRRHPVELRVGDALDFWRVEAIEPPRLLRLRAEMKVPGRAWLEFEVKPYEGGSEIRQTAIFDPMGICGRLYWYSLFPIHAYVFRGMLKAIVKAAQQD